MWQESLTAASLGRPPVSGAMPRSQSCGARASCSGQVAKVTTATAATLPHVSTRQTLTHLSSCTPLSPPFIAGAAITIRSTQKNFPPQPTKNPRVHPAPHAVAPLLSHPSVDCAVSRRRRRRRQQQRQRQAVVTTDKRYHARSHDRGVRWWGRGDAG